MIKLFLFLAMLSTTYGALDDSYLEAAYIRQKEISIDFFLRCNAFAQQSEAMEENQRKMELEKLSSECEKQGRDISTLASYIGNQRLYNHLFLAYDHFIVGSERIKMQENDKYSICFLPFAFGFNKEQDSALEKNVWKFFQKSPKRKLLLEERLYGNGPVKDVLINNVVSPSLFIELKNKINMIYDLIDSRFNYYQDELSNEHNSVDKEVEIQKKQTYANVLLKHISAVRDSISPDNYKIDALIKMYAILQLDFGYIDIPEDFQVDMLNLFDNIHIPYRERFRKESLLLDIFSRDIFFFYSDNYFEKVDKKDSDQYIKIRKEISDIKDQRSIYYSQFPHLKKFENEKLTQLLKVADLSISELNQEAFKSGLRVKMRDNFPKFSGVISHVGYYIDLLDKLEVEKNMLFGYYDDIVRLSQEEKAQFKANRIPQKVSKKDQDFLLQKKSKAKDYRGESQTVQTAQVDQPADSPAVEEPKEIDFDAEIRALRLEKWREFCAQRRNIRTTPNILHDIAVDASDPVSASHDFDFSLFDSGSLNKSALYAELMRIGAKVRINPNLTGKDFVHLTLGDRKYVIIFHMDHGIDKGINFAGYRRLQSILKNER